MSTDTPNRQEADASTPLLPDTNPEDLTVVDTGAGLLIYETEREYRPHLDNDVETARRLVGFADVQDWRAIEDAVRARGHPAGDVFHLPDLDPSQLPSPAEAAA